MQNPHTYTLPWMAFCDSLGQHQYNLISHFQMYSIYRMCMQFHVSIEEQATTQHRECMLYIPKDRVLAIGGRLCWVLHGQMKCYWWNRHLALNRRQLRQHKIFQFLWHSLWCICWDRWWIYQQIGQVDKGSKTCTILCLEILGAINSY